MSASACACPSSLRSATSIDGFARAATSCTWVVRATRTATPSSRRVTRWDHCLALLSTAARLTAASRVCCAVRPKGLETRWLLWPFFVPMWVLIGAVCDALLQFFGCCGAPEELGTPPLDCQMHVSKLDPTVGWLTLLCAFAGSASHLRAAPSGLLRVRERRSVCAVSCSSAG